jgi:hypothetical protein
LFLRRLEYTVFAAWRVDDGKAGTGLATTCRSLTLKKVNISRIGQTSLFQTDDDNGGLLGELTNAAKGGVNNLLGDLTGDIVHAMDLPDFFTIYLRGYCSGLYSANASDVPPAAQVTRCTNHSAIFRFSPTEMIEHALPHNITLDDLHWPSAIGTTEHALRAVGIVLSLFYLLSLLSIGIALFLAAWKTFFRGTLSAWLAHGIDMVRYPE